MAVNIFGGGRSITGGSGEKGRPGIGFKILDGEGNFNIDSKRLANVAFPENDSDAVVKSYTDTLIEEKTNSLHNDISNVMEDMKTDLERGVSTIATSLSRVDDTVSRHTNDVSSIKRRIDSMETDMKF